MKVEDLLKKAGIPMGAYVGLRQSGVTFLSARATRKDGLAYEHLVATKAFALLRAHGVNRKGAGLAVEKAFPAIRELTLGASFRSAKPYKIGVAVVVSKGRLVTVPLEDGPRDAAEVGRIEFDMRAIAALLPVDQNDESWADDT